MPTSEFHGVHSNLRPRFRYADSSAEASPSMMIAKSTTVVGNDANTTEKTAATFTIPPKTLRTNGDVLKVYVRFNAAAGGSNAKRFRIYFGGTGGTSVWDSGSVAYNASTFPVTVYITRTGQNTQVADSSGSSATGGTAVNISLSSAPTQDLDTAIDVVVTVQSASSVANQALMTHAQVEVIPVPF